jgi:hypothetical protein
MQYAAIMIDSHMDEGGARALLQLIDAADRIESLIGTSERLAVYGSLSPGRQNHHIVEPLDGRWTDGGVEAAAPAATGLADSWTF